MTYCRHAAIRIKVGKIRTLFRCEDCGMKATRKARSRATSKWKTAFETHYRELDSFRIVQQEFAAITYREEQTRKAAEKRESDRLRWAKRQRAVRDKARLTAEMRS